ncbi:MAG: T9SS type A sorting domain-containing protein [bacterium]
MIREKTEDRKQETEDRRQSSKLKAQGSRLLAIGSLIFFLIPFRAFSAPSLYNRKQGEEKRIETKALPPSGTISVIFLRIEFSDVKFTKDSDYFKNLMERMKNYYCDVSFGKLNLTSTITQPLALTETMGYYGKGKEEDGSLLKNDAIATATANGIILSNYDAIMILHSGAGEETTINNFDQIHSQNLGTISTIPEMENFGISAFGVWCHEFAHSLGLIDQSQAGPWSLMDIGCYNGQGEYPAGLDAYSRMRLNWVTAISTTTLTLNPNDLSVYQLGSSPDFFLVEKRSEPGLGEGFLVWHLKGNMTQLERISLLPADGGNLGDSGDPFPGTTRNFLIDDYTSPSLRYFDGSPSGFKIEFLIPHIPKAKVFPNPINLNQTKRVFFEVERGGEVYIYNIKGENIKYLLDSQNIGRIYWDIENIASGVYIFMVTDKEGNRSFGKIGIIK